MSNPRFKFRHIVAHTWCESVSIATAAEFRRGLAASLIIATLSSSSATSAPSCIDYGSHLHGLGVLAGHTNDCVTVDGTRAYAGDGELLLVIDFSDPSSPQRVGEVAVGGGVRGVAISGALAYVATSNRNSLVCVDVSNPNDPHVLGTIDTPGAPTAVTVSGDHAYVAAETQGVHIVDIRIPAAMRIESRIPPSGLTLGVAFTGEHAFIADFNGGLWIFDVSNAATPRFVSELPLPYVQSVGVSGSYAYVAGSAGLHVVDISDVEHPVTAGRSWMQVYTFGLAIEGERVYLGAGTLGLLVFDISNPNAPDLLGNIQSSGAAIGVAAADEVVLVAGGRLQMFDATDPTTPQFIGQEYLWQGAERIAVAGNLAYATGRHQLVVIDVSDPLTPHVLGQVEVPPEAPNEPEGIAVFGSYVYQATGPSGLQVFDVSDPTRPRFVAEALTSYLASSVAVSETHAYVTERFAGLHIFDLTDPRMPREVGAIDTWDAVDVVVSGSYAYVADTIDLKIIDVSDPGTPRSVANVSTVYGCSSVTLADERAYFVGSNPGCTSCGSNLSVVDISDPPVPRLLGTTWVPEGTGTVEVLGRYAYTAGGPGGIQVIDVSDPSAPHHLGNTATFHRDAPAVLISSSDLARMDGAILAATSWGLSVAALQCPQPTPVLLSELAATIRDGSILLHWHSEAAAGTTFTVMRCVAANLDGPDSPVGTAMHGAGLGDWEFLDRDIQPERTYDYRIEARLQTGEVTMFGPIRVLAIPHRGLDLAPVFPFPARDTAFLSFSLPRAGTTSIDIYDVFGHRIRRLVAAFMDAGEHRVHWDGRDEAGRRVGSGLYVARLFSSGGTRTRRLMLAR